MKLFLPLIVCIGFIIHNSDAFVPIQKSFVNYVASHDLNTGSTELGMSVVDATMQVNDIVYSKKVIYTNPFFFFF